MMSSIRAYERSDASRVAPYEYVYLALRLLWDVWLFGTVPRRSTLLGMVLIAGSGGFVAWREGRPVRAHSDGDVPWSEKRPDEGDGP